MENFNPHSSSLLTCCLSQFDRNEYESCRPEMTFVKLASAGWTQRCVRDPCLNALMSHQNIPFQDTELISLHHKPACFVKESARCLKCEADSVTRWHGYLCKVMPSRSILKNPIRGKTHCRAWSVGNIMTLNLRKGKSEPVAVSKVDVYEYEVIKFMWCVVI